MRKKIFSCCQLWQVELKRRHLTEELREVLIEYQQLELEIDLRRIVIPWLMPTNGDPGAQICLSDNGEEITVRASLRQCWGPGAC
jgi:hypothetical protein